MANRAAHIAGPMLRRFDANGVKRAVASPEAVRDALELARFPVEVVNEWANEARRRAGLKSQSAIIGNTYRRILRNRELDRLAAQDRRAANREMSSAIHQMKYRPGIFARAVAAFKATMHRRALRKLHSRKHARA